MTEVTFERRQERLAVTKCTKEKIQEAGYRKKYVDVCKQEYLAVPYKLPTVIANFDDFLELNIPEPELKCQLYKYEVPKVTCKVRI